MSTESFGVKQTFTAGEDLSSKQYYLVKLSGTNEVSLAGAAENVCGILYNKPTADQQAAVLTANGVKAPAIAGASVSAGDLLESDAYGRVVPFTYDADGATETYMVGRAVTAAGAANEYITVLTQFAPASK